MILREPDAFTMALWREGRTWADWRLGYLTSDPWRSDAQEAEMQRILAAVVEVNPETKWPTMVCERQG